VQAVGTVADPAVRRTLVIGWSRRHRPIRAVESGDPDSRVRAVIVGVIHGNETAGTSVTSALVHMIPPPETDLWIIPTANPDGQLAGTRGNAVGVDLSRNFPYRWEALGNPGSTFH
jgi:protein MpaA